MIRQRRGVYCDSGAVCRNLFSLACLCNVKFVDAYDFNRRNSELVK